MQALREQSTDPKCRVNQCLQAKKSGGPNQDCRKKLGSSVDTCLYEVISHEEALSWCLHVGVMSGACFIVAYYLVKADITSQLFLSPDLTWKLQWKDSIVVGGWHSEGLHRRFSLQGYRAAFDAWKARWNRWVDVGGKYLESFWRFVNVESTKTTIPSSLTLLSGQTPNLERPKQR